MPDLPPVPGSPSFRFLSHAEFNELDQAAKADYLLRAVQELAKMTATLTSSISSNGKEKQ